MEFQTLVEIHDLLSVQRWNPNWSALDYGRAGESQLCGTGEEKAKAKRLPHLVLSKGGSFCDKIDLSSLGWWEEELLADYSLSEKAHVINKSASSWLHFLFITSKMSKNLVLSIWKKIIEQNLPLFLEGRRGEGRGKHSDRKAVKCQDRFVIIDPTQKAEASLFLATLGTMRRCWGSDWVLPSACISSSQVLPDNIFPKISSLLWQLCYSCKTSGPALMGHQPAASCPRPE